MQGRNKRYPVRHIVVNGKPAAESLGTAADTATCGGSLTVASQQRDNLNTRAGLPAHDATSQPVAISIRGPVA